MAVFFYTIFLGLFKAGTLIAFPFNNKAKKWVQGRKNIFEKLRDAIPADQKIIWMHCSSLGEFEQGRPVLEKLRILYPSCKLLLTFFSPSGYEVQKNYKGADWVFYLPMDSHRNAKRFIELVQPVLVIFVKYELWYYYLKKIKYSNIPLLLISALFRKDMSYFQWYGRLGQKMLSRFDHLFVQNESSKELIAKIGLGDRCSISGDTRFDRVIAIAAASERVTAVEQFINTGKAIIAGSTWPEDEEVLKNAFSTVNDPGLKLIIAPHEVNEKHLNDLKKLFPDAIFYSELRTRNPKLTGTNILIIDNIGLLSQIYKYGYLAYVGGGFTKSGIHNVLEAAVYDKIVFFGPNYKKYSEAVGLILAGGGLPFNNLHKNGQMLAALIEALLADKADYDYRSKAAGDFVRLNKGATQKIIQYIQENRLLTS